MHQQLTSTEFAKLKLWYVLHHSVTSYFKLLHLFQDVEESVDLTNLARWQQLKMHNNHIDRLRELHTASGQEKFQQRFELIKKHCDHILFDGNDDYPDQLSHYEDRPPILFIRGQKDVLRQAQIAIVGSRKPSPHGAQVAYDFSSYFASQGSHTTSGLAIGIDAAAHHGAIHQGQSIAVIGTGLDQCYPSEHQQLSQNIIDTGGAIVTEFFPATPPAKQNFPRRNRIISGLSAATLVVEAGLKSGSLITAKTAAEQGKSVFAIPGHIYSQFHQGCHQLIREGATLIDHPEQLLEDLNAFRPQLDRSQSANAIQLKKSQKIQRQEQSQQHVQTNPTQVEIPAHLAKLYAELDWVGLSIDELATRVQTSISELNVALVELELLGACRQHAGRYLRC